MYVFMCVHFFDCVPPIFCLFIFVLHCVAVQSSSPPLSSLTLSPPIFLCCVVWLHSLSLHINFLSLFLHSDGYTSMCVCVCVQMYTSTCTISYAHVCSHKYSFACCDCVCIGVCVCVCMCMFVCLIIGVHVCLCVFVYYRLVCVRISVFVSICMKVFSMCIDVHFVVCVRASVSTGCTLLCAPLV